MRSFTDDAGREWKLSLSYAVLKRMKAAGVDVFQFVCEGCESSELLDRFELFGRILWCWLEPQIDKQGLQPDEFAEAICGSALSESFEAVREEVLDFLSQTNPTLAKILRKATAAEQLILTKANQAAEAISISS